MTKRILATLCLVFLCLPALALAQKNMTDARPEIRQLLSEPTAKFWTDAQVDSAWNRAQAEVGLLAGILIQRFATVRLPQDSATTGGVGKGAGYYYYKFGVAPMRLRSVFVDSGSRGPVFVTIVDNPGQIPYLGAARKPVYCYMHDSLLVFYPMVGADSERVQVSYFGRPANITSASTATDLPFFIQPAAVWLAASFLMNQNNQYEVANNYYKRAVDLVAAYKAAFQMQYEPIRGAGASGAPSK